MCQALTELGKLCGYLPEPIGSECKKMVDQDGPFVLNGVLDMLTPELICRAIKFCEADKQNDG